MKWSKFTWWSLKSYETCSSLWNLIHNYWCKHRENAHEIHFSSRKWLLVVFPHPIRLKLYFHCFSCSRSPLAPLVSSIDSFKLSASTGMTSNQLIRPDLSLVKVRSFIVLLTGKSWKPPPPPTTTTTNTHSLFSIE